jgi:4-hydroxysphinganine ceramide fatty acyl 2-hydroxylase
MLNFEQTCLWTFIGVLSWTFFEYAFHRFFFHAEDHWLPASVPSIFAFHFLIHGVHHAYPQDRMRLVFPPFMGYQIFYGFFMIPIQSNVPEIY